MFGTFAILKAIFFGEVLFAVILMAAFYGLHRMSIQVRKELWTLSRRG